MELAPGWQIIVGCPVGGRDIVLFYDSLTGNGLTAYIESTNVGVPLKAFTLSPGWTHIAFCNRRLLFFNEHNGVANIGTIQRNGEVLQSAVAEFLGPGPAVIFSDGHYLAIERVDMEFPEYTTRLMCTLTPPAFFGAPPKLKIVHKIEFTHGDWGYQFVAERDLIVAYYSNYRLWADIHFRFIDMDGNQRGVGGGEIDPDYHTVILSNGYLLFYDNGVGAGKIVSPDGLLKSQPGKFAAIQPYWSHLIAVGPRILFYSEHNGKARVGYISPNGEFSGETHL